MPRLTSQQSEALNALRWLNSNDAEDRGSGRTLVLAVHYLRQAIDQERTPTDWISVRDHFPQGIGVISQVLQQIVEASGNRGIIEVQRMSPYGFRLHSKPASLRRYIYEEFVQEPLVGKTLRQRIIDHVLDHPGFTSTQIANTLRVTPASVALVLLQEYKSGNLVRKSGEGPRGGATYYPVVPPEEQKVGLSLYELIRRPPYMNVNGVEGVEGVDDD